MSFVAIHKHVIIRATVNKPMTSRGQAKLMLRHFVDELGMVQVTPPQSAYVEEKGNEGLTGSINLATSHIAFHVWDTTGLLMMDIYSCKEFDTHSMLRLLDVYFEVVSLDSVVEIDRATTEFTRVI